MPKSASARNKESLKIEKSFTESLRDAILPIELPDIVTFAESEHFCNKKLYPRQRTLLRLMFLDTEHMTDYDREVIDEWKDNFFVGEDRIGVPPDIWQRVEWCKANGYNHFREIEFIGGRRGGKGHLGGIIGAYQTYKMIALDSPQWHYGVDPNKDLYLFVTATNLSQARDYQYKDIAETISNAPCFEKFLSTNKGLSLTLRTPADIRKIAELERRNVPMDREIASIRIVALSSNSRAGRGAATYCLDPSTPVLKSDLQWVPIVDLKVGQELIGIDEFGESKFNHRKLRKATVEAIKRTKGPALRLTMDDGSNVICSYNHRWMLERSSASHAPVWREAKKLKVNDRIRYLVDPWEEDKSYEAGYLAGFYDGEGCIVAPNKNHHGDLLLTQNPGPTLDKALEMLRNKNFDPIRYSGEEHHEGKLCQQWAISGVREKLRFLGTIKPERLLKKSDWVWEGYTLRALNGNKSYKTIVEIEELPEQELIDIQTSTRTFIANGLISHNSLFFDEMAHMMSQTEGPNTAEEVYKALTPSLDQMGKEGLIYIPTSPYSKVGQAYNIYQQGITSDANGDPLVPNLLVVQMPSWEPYKDWDNPKIVTPGTYRGAPQTYDEEVRKLEERDPDSFKVERRAQWSEVINSYLNPQIVDKIFDPIKYPDGEIRELKNQQPGVSRWIYRGHADPGVSQANFAVAIGHTEPFWDEELGENMFHVVFDYLQVWRPQDFPDHQVDYMAIEEQMVEIITKYPTLKTFSFDQYGGFVTVPYLKSHLRKRGHQARVRQATFTPKSNQVRAERFKSALGMGWVHAPRDAFAADNLSLLELELKFLQLKNGKVVKQEVGPVTTKDLADAVMEVTSELLADQIDRRHNRAALAGGRLSIGAPGGYHSNMESSSARGRLSAYGSTKGSKEGYAQKRW